MKILAVDDEAPIRELITYNLERESYTVITAENGAEALRCARTESPALILLDLMLPDMSGLDVCRVLKNDVTTAHIPVIMVTAKTEDTDIVTGLELGADDYVTKPFSPKVLSARIRSVLRRGEPVAAQEQGKLTVRSLTIDPLRHEASVNNKPIELSATEFALLEYFTAHPGQVFSRRQIITAIKGDSYPVTERAIDVQILGVRRKLESAGEPDLIETIRGVGYRISEDDRHQE